MPVSFMPSCQHPSCQHAKNFSKSRCQKHANNFHANTFMSIFLHAKTLHAIKTKPLMPTCRNLFHVKMSQTCQQLSCQHLHVNISSCQNPACYQNKTLHANMPRPISSQDVKKHDDNKRSCQNLHVNILSCQNPLLRITCMPSKQNPSCQHAETFFMSRCLLLWNIVGQQIKQILLNVVPGTRHEGLPRF